MIKKEIAVPYYKLDIEVPYTLPEDYIIATDVIKTMAVMRYCLSRKYGVNEVL